MSTFRRFCARYGMMWLLVLVGCHGQRDGGADSRLDWGVTMVHEVRDPEDWMSPQPWGVTADPTLQQIYVVDSPNHRVLVFDSSGAFLRQFGRSGSGPGEFRSPWAISLRPDGMLTVLDSESGLMSRWTPHGEWLGSTPFPPSYWGPALADLGNRLVVVTTTPTSDPTEIRQDLIEFRGETATLLASVPQFLTQVKLPCLRTSIPAPKPLAPQPIWTAHGDTIFVVAGPEYVINAFHEGRLIRSYGRDLSPVTVTESMAVNRIETGELRFLMNQCGVDSRTVAASLDWSETVAPIQRLTMAPDGRLWATRTGAGVGRSSVDVFEPDGRYIGTVSRVPEPISFLGRDRYVAFSYDDDFSVRVQVVQVAMDQR